MVRIKRYKSYTLKRYKRHKSCPFETYEPNRRVELRKEHTLPFLFSIGNIFVNLGGSVSFLCYGFFNGLKQLFGFKKTFERKIRSKGKIIEIKVNKNGD